VAPCLAARRPVVAILHADSPGAALLARSEQTTLVTFRDDGDVERASGELALAFPRVASLVGRELDDDSALLEPFTARALTAAQCALFDRVLKREAKEA
jgi:hypothetical protein